MSSVTGKGGTSYIVSLILCAIGLVIQLMTAFSMEFKGSSEAVAHLPPKPLGLPSNSTTITATAITQPTMDRKVRSVNHDMMADEIEESSFSACLLVMDENHRLVEFIAYHYYVLSLRYLIIAVDPHSSEMPTEVVDRWRDRMVIEVWQDSDYITLQEQKNVTRKPGKMQVAIKNHKRHKMRQRIFYKRCGRHLKRKGMKWTIMYDVDEYLAINSAMVKNARSLIKHPGHGQTLLHQLLETAKKVPKESLIGYHFGKDCIMLPRIWYGHIESAPKHVEKEVPLYLNPYRFDTLRWRHRTTHNSSEPKLGKAIVDVSKIPDDNFAVEAFGNAHRPFEICEKSSPWLTYKLPIGLHHYIGSWEQYNYRKNDARDGLNDRRGRAVWMERGKTSAVRDDEVRPWIQGFANFLRNDTAEVKRLLKGAGLSSKRSRQFLARRRSAK